MIKVLIKYTGKKLHIDNCVQAGSQKSVVLQQTPTGPKHHAWCQNSTQASPVTYYYFHYYYFHYYFVRGII